MQTKIGDLPADASAPRLVFDIVENALIYGCQRLFLNDAIKFRVATARLKTSDRKGALSSLAAWVNPSMG